MNWTAYHAVARADVDAASTVLVSGGAGAVAHYAIQFAKARGAVVITTVSSEAKAKLARDAGADHAIDYKRTDVGAAVKELTDGSGVDSVIELDIAANAKLMPAVIRPKGKIVVYGTGALEAPVPLQFFLTNAITLEFIFVYELSPQERSDAVGAINARAGQERARPQHRRDVSARQDRRRARGGGKRNAVPATW